MCWSSSSNVLVIELGGPGQDEVRSAPSCRNVSGGFASLVIPPEFRSRSKQRTGDIRGPRVTDVPVSSNVWNARASETFRVSEALLFRPRGELGSICRLRSRTFCLSAGPEPPIGGTSKPWLVPGTKPGNSSRCVTGRRRQECSWRSDRATPWRQRSDLPCGRDRR